MNPRRVNPLAAGLQPSDLAENPHPILHRLRESAPVLWVPSLEAWLVTRHDLAVSLMRKAQTFTVDHPGFSTARVVGRSMLSADGDDHRRHRAPFEKPFRRTDVQQRLHHVVQATVGRLLDGIAAAGQADLQMEFAAPLAVETMLTVLGLPHHLLEDLRGWYAAIVEAVTRVTAGEEVSGEGRAAFAALQDNLLPVLAQKPETSLLAAAAGMAQGLNAEEIIANAAVLLFGGIETTEGMIANALYHLFVNPHVLAAVRGDYSLVPAAIEESLRLEPAAAVVDRYAVHDVEFGGAAITAGDLVRVSLSAANRDPQLFPQPNHFDLRRPNLRQHVAFAQGPHVCLGLHLARLEAAEALTQLLQRLPALRLAEGGEEDARPRGLVFRKPRALSVQWDT